MTALTERKAPVEVEGLVERLRRCRSMDAAIRDNRPVGSLYNPDGPEAADALQSQATELATLKQRIAELEAENFRLAAGQCTVENGLIGDDRGHFACSLKQQLAERDDALRSADACLRRPGPVDYRIIEAVAYTCVGHSRTDGGDQ